MRQELLKINGNKWSFLALVFLSFPFLFKFEVKFIYVFFLL